MIMKLLQLRRGDGAIRAIGEQYHHKSLTNAWKQINDPDNVAIALIPEPTNRYDSNAIRMDLLVDGKSFTAGYVASEEAVQYAPKLWALWESGHVGYGYGRIRQYPDQFQVYLLASSDPDSLVPPAVTDPIGEFIDGSYPLTVVGEERYQDVIAPYANFSRQYVFAMHPSTIEKGKYAGQETYSVYLDGLIVGTLTRAMSAKHGPLFKQVLSEGRRPYLAGRIEADHRGYQVILDGPHRQASSH